MEAIQQDQDPVAKSRADGQSVMADDVDESQTGAGACKVKHPVLVLPRKDSTDQYLANYRATPLNEVAHHRAASHNCANLPSEKLQRGSKSMQSR